MSDTLETITWHPIAEKPLLRMRVVVHALNNYYQIGLWDESTQKFWDKDNQPIVAGIEWSYRPDRDE